MSTDLLKNVGKGINLEKVFKDHPFPPALSLQSNPCLWVICKQRVSLGKDDNEEAVPLSQLGRPRHKMTCNHR